MYKNKIACTLLTPIALALLSAPASAAITLYDEDGTTFSADGYVNAFYVQTDTDNINDDLDRDQARVKMGFLPNYIGFNMGKDMGDLTLGARSSFWVTINDSETNGTSTAIDVRQFYGTIGGDWGEVLVGKDFGLFARSNILLDEMLAGYGQVSDTLGLVDGGGVSFGNIGSGYPYPFPTAQITYRSPVMGGLRIAAGIMDPVDTSDDTAVGKNYQDAPRFETEITYQFDLAGADIYSWVSAGYQTSKNTDSTVDDVTSQGFGYGVQAKMGALSLTASGFDAEGVNPFFTNNAGEAVLREIDSTGYLMQGSYTFGGKTRLALSYGKTEDDGNGLGVAADYETRAIGLFHSINEHLTLVAEYHQFEIEDRTNNLTIEETDSVALGVALSW
tara:strand:- start:315 stop:1481 length:1167 start_codon:yes stop_codon:yes gene_type:complete